MTDKPDAQKSVVFTPRSAQDLTAPAAPRAVRSKRKILIFSAILVLTGILSLGWTQFLGENNAIEISVQSVASTKTTGIEMTGARYAGTTASGKRYLITADKASEEQFGSGEITLIAPDGTLDGEGSNQVRVRANEAIYYANDEQMHMRGDVVLYQSERELTLRTAYAEADIGEGRFEAPQPVVMQSPSLYLTSQAMLARDGGSYFLFTGKTRLVMQPATQKKDQNSDSIQTGKQQP